MVVVFSKSSRGPERQRVTQIYKSLKVNDQEKKDKKDRKEKKKKKIIKKTHNHKNCGKTEVITVNADALDSNTSNPASLAQQV